MTQYQEELLAIVSDKSLSLFRGTVAGDDIWQPLMTSLAKA